MADGRPSRALAVACTVSVFVSAFLLFAVQPYAARLMLPRFGGSPAVWTTSIVFFQVLLLAGYAYAHYGALRATPRRAFVVHGVLLAAPLLLLPPVLGPDVLVEAPTAALLGALALAIGGPFFVLSTHTPLAQRWLLLGRGHRAEDPYFLYAASNAGSLLALLSWPLLLEPRFGLAAQGRALSIGYALFAGLAVWIGWLAVRRGGGAPVELPGSANQPASGPTASRRLRWFALSATGSALLLGATLRITTDVAPMPLLWVLPLGLYLATFIVAFGPGVRTGSLALRAAVMATVAAAIGTLVLQTTGPAVVLIGVHVAAMTAGCLLVHGRLAQDRPAPEQLTSFYLWQALGGAAGGVLSQIVAPWLFDDVVEYPLALVAAVAWLTPWDELRAGLRGAAGGRLLLATAAALVVSALVVAQGSPSAVELVLYVPTLAMLVALAVPGRARSFPVVAAACAVFLLADLHRTGDVVERERGFYGVVTVVDRGDVREMLHGSILHGAQTRDRPGVPRTYYSPDGPMAGLVRTAPAGGRICIVGLGAGSLAVFAQPTQRLTWFEVDPVVRDAALEHFGFLEHAPVEPEIVLGDARLTLAEVGGPPCDLLLVDAFSGDAVPMHLLTREALAVYRDALAPGGVLAFHVSCRHFDLKPVLRGLAADAGLEATFLVDVPDDERVTAGASGSRVVVLDERPRTDLPTPGPRWRPLGSEPAVLWTDDRASLLEIWTPLRDLQYPDSVVRE